MAAINGINFTPSLKNSSNDKLLTMKTKLAGLKNGIMLLVLSLCVSLYSLAQEEAAGVNLKTTETTTTTWYSAPWVWIVGIALFILLFAAIVRGGGSRSEA